MRRRGPHGRRRCSALGAPNHPAIATMQYRGQRCGNECGWRPVRSGSAGAHKVERNAAPGRRGSNAPNCKQRRERAAAAKSWPSNTEATQEEGSVPMRLEVDPRTPPRSRARAALPAWDLRGLKVLVTNDGGQVEHCGPSGTRKSDPRRRRPRRGPPVWPRGRGRTPHHSCGAPRRLRGPPHVAAPGGLLRGPRAIPRINRGNGGRDGARRWEGRWTAACEAEGPTSENKQ